MKALNIFIDLIIPSVKPRSNSGQLIIKIRERIFEQFLLLQSCFLGRPA
jgi:hypothetical protein